MTVNRDCCDRKVVEWILTSNLTHISTYDTRYIQIISIVCLEETLCYK